MTLDDCLDVRASLSAHIDGEDAPLRVDEVDRHVLACDACTDFTAGLPLLQERVAAALATPVADRTADVLAAAGAERVGAGARRLRDLRGLLGLAAVVQLVLAAVTLAGVGGDHVARDLATFELAAAGGLAAAVWRPRYAAGMLPVIGLAAAIGVVTVVLDVLAGTSSVGAELAHLVLLVATWPLAVLAREHEGPSATVPQV